MGQPWYMLYALISFGTMCSVISIFIIVAGIKELFFESTDKKD